MGNCLHHTSSSSSSSPMQWGGDDWGSFAISDHDRDYYHKGMKMEEHEEAEEGCLLGDISDCDNNVKSGGGVGDFKVSSSTKTATTTEVKIKITKKQLEELLGRAELKQLSVQQVLAQLMNVSDQYETNQRSWRPALQSIPEVN